MSNFAKNNLTQQIMFIFIPLGLLFGASFELLRHYDVTHVIYYSIPWLFCLLYGLAFNQEHNLRLIITSLITSVILSLPILCLNTEFPNYPETAFSLIAGFPLFVYIGHAFHYAMHHDNRWRVSYSSLFMAVWSTFPLLIAAGIFALIAHGLILMAASMFQVLGYPALQNIYVNNNHIYNISLAILFFIGLGIAQYNQKIINNLRFLLMRMMEYLYPLLAVITLVYFIMYISQITSVNENTVLTISLSLAILGIIFFNAHFQTGKETFSYPKFFYWLFFVYRLILGVLSIIIVVQCLRLFQISLNSLLYLSLMVAYCIWYALTALFSNQKQIKLICKGNIVIAIIFFILMIIINNPIKSFNINTGFGTAVAPIDEQKKFGETTKKTDTEIQAKAIKIDKNLTNHQLFWTSDVSKELINLGQDNQGIYLCRVFHANGYQIGQFIHQRCWITYSGMSFMSYTYQLLAGTNKNVLKWVPYTSNEQGVPLGIEPLTPFGNVIPTRSLYACLAHYETEIYLGKIIEKKCNIGVGEKEIAVPIESILVLQPQ